MEQTREQFLNALRDLKQPVSEVNAPSYRYVIYARKSTNDKEKQERSLPDQITSCEEYAADHELKVVDIIQEAESAKTSDTRPKFRKMLNDITSGKYDGVLAWHPDRLARNMKDAGEVIDLLDREIIKDLRFPSFTFENTASGKMLLGITFVLSKQYSDKLSDDVNRGNKLGIQDGEYVNRAKHGYYKDINQRLHPDGDNFLLIKNAFQLRLMGSTLDEISDYLNKAGYLKWQKDGSHRSFRWTKQKVQVMMSDPIYTGVLVYGRKGGSIDLSESYGFEAVVTVDEFMRINKLDEKSKLFKLARKFRSGKDVKANLLRGMVFCEGCSEVMYPGITNKPKQKKKYFYFRCDTEDCDRRPRSVRANVIVAYIKSFLIDRPFSNKHSYEHYSEEMKRIADERSRETRTFLLARRKRKAKLENDLMRAKELLYQEKGDGKLLKILKDDLKRIEDEVGKVETEIKEGEIKLDSEQAVVVTYDNFLELMEKLAQTLTSLSNLDEIDFVARKLFTNFTISGENVGKTTLSAPFDSLYGLKVLTRGRERT